MTDITISAHEAKNLADFLRRHGIGEHHSLIRTLDPPAPSLRDEVTDIVRIRNSGHSDSHYDDQADAVLAVVRRHVEALPTAPSVSLLYIDGRESFRGDVLHLLGGDQ